MQAEDYIQSRVDDQIAWYNKKSGINKKSYYTCQVLVLVCGALIPLLTGYVDAIEFMKYIVGTLGAVVVVFQGLIELKKYKDNWTTYRLTAEQLQREKLLYQTSASPYGSAKDPFKLFVANAEAIMANENKSWKSLREDEGED